MVSEKYKNFLSWVVYQVYPRSFKDSNGDGIGDLCGVIEKLDYLKELGVDAIWLCPCYKSPNDDNGYDIADYRDIMDEFGTLDDAKRLISELHARDMKLIMDLVPNHTSTEHRWFQESRKSNDNPYSDYYYWADEPLNDWKSEFCGSAWQYDELRGQYYLHSYAIRQADLNWENPAVLKEMQEVVDFWVDLGVDGFRCDVIDQISKDFENNRNCFGPRLHEFIHALFGREKTKNIFTVGECWASDIEEVRRHAASEREELTTLFQFEHMGCGREDKFTPKADSLKSVRDILIKWQELTIANDLIYTLFTDNHDQSRYISRVGNDRELRYESATCIATMFYTLRGIPFIYQGQEFGMTAAHYDSIKDFDDIESFNMYDELCESLTPQQALEKINFGGRDNARRPLAWSGEEYAGFSVSEPWLKTYSRYKEINLEKDLASEKSVFGFYKRLLALRKSSPEILYGDFKVLSNSEDGFFAFTREYEGGKILVICNFEKKSNVSLDLNGGKLLLSNCGRTADINGEYSEYEIAVYKI